MHYESKYVVCPFYKRNIDANRICCEGVDPTNTLNLVFGNKKELLRYEKRYCNSMERYQSCLICQMLTAKEEGRQ